MVILLSIPTFSIAMSIEEIYERVKKEMKSIDYPLPKIYIYNDVDFNAIASELILCIDPHNFYAFHSKGTILMRCKYVDFYFDEVIAHEMVHYIQYKQDGDPFIDPMGMFDERDIREWKARNIQEEFRIMFCK